MADVLNKAVNAVPSEALQESQYLKDMHQGLQLTETQLLKVGVKVHLKNIQGGLLNWFCAKKCLPVSKFWYLELFHLIWLKKF